MRSKVFVKYIASYMLVLATPIILIGTLNYGWVVGILREEVTNSAQGLLYQIRDVSDVHVNELTSISYIINQKQNMNQLFNRQKDYFDDTYPVIFNCIKELKDYKISNSMIDHIFLYIKSSDTIISDTSKQSFDSEFNWSYIYEGVPADELRKKLNGIKKMTVWPSANVNDGGGTKGVITYIKPLPISGAEKKAVLMVTISDTSFKQLISNVLNEYSNAVLILDSENNVIFNTSSGNVKLDSSKIQGIIDSVNSRKSKNFTEVRGDMLITSVKSDNTGWHYIAAIPSSQILEKVDYIKVRSIIILAATMLIGIILSFFFSKGNYTDVKRIADIISAARRGNSAAGRFRNEWEFIGNAVSGYIIENTSLQQKLLDQMPVMRRNYLYKLINGEYRDMETINSIMEFLKLELKQKELAVMLVSIDNYFTYTGMHNELERGIIRVAIAEKIEEICGSEGRGYTVEIGNDKTAVLFDFDMIEGSGTDALKQIGLRIREYIITNFDFTVTVGISAVCSEILDIRRAYSEACEAADYKMVKGENSVICYDDIKENAHNRKFYSFKQEDQIINYLRLGEYEMILDILEDIVDTAKNEAVSLSTGKCIYLEIINTAIKASDELGIVSSVIEQNLPSLVRQDTLDGVCREAGEFFKCICQQVNNAKGSKTIELVRRVLEYMNNCYADKSMSVEQAAREFSVSPSYFSRFFKEQVGSSFVDYLHHIRLTKAKELLVSSEKSVTEIADEVGYNSIHNFVRVFKRYENITPSEYRPK